MKRILIVSQTMGLGGIERSLLGLLYSVDYTKYDVDLFLMHPEGELMDSIPKEVHLLPTISECTCYAVPIKNVIKKGEIFMCIGRAFAKYKAKSFKKKNRSSKLYSSVELEYSHKYTMPFVPELDQKGSVYDLAISFATPHYFVRDKVRAKKKIAWIHTDYSTIEIDKKSELEMWKAFDYIVGVSEECVGRFLDTFPELVGKTKVVENILLSETVRKNSCAEIIEKNIFDKSNINLLSVGRFDGAKNFEAIPEIVKRLQDKGLKVKWYIIGFGQTENNIRKNIKKYNVADSVIILGKKDNPYPYMKLCDVYVQPSKFEGKCVAVREAQILCKPVIITRYETAMSQVESGVNGYIIEQGTENIVKGLYELLSNRECLEIVAQNCAGKDFGNQNEIKKVYQMLEE